MDSFNRILEQSFCALALMIVFTTWQVLGATLPVIAEQLIEANTAQQVIIRVDGASCPFCAFGLEKRLGHLAGVLDVAMELKAGKAIVTLKEGATVSEDALRQAVKEAGFTAREITFPAGASNTRQAP